MFSLPLPTSFQPLFLLNPLLLPHHTYFAFLSFPCLQRGSVLSFWKSIPTFTRNVSNIETADDDWEFSCLYETDFAPGVLLIPLAESIEGCGYCTKHITKYIRRHSSLNQCQEVLVMSFRYLLCS